MLVVSYKKIGEIGKIGRAIAQMWQEEGEQELLLSFLINQRDSRISRPPNHKFSGNQRKAGQKEELVLD